METRETSQLAPPRTEGRIPCPNLASRKITGDWLYLGESEKIRMEVANVNAFVVGNLSRKSEKEAPRDRRHRTERCADQGNGRKP
jgi:hypothetical protein